MTAAITSSILRLPDERVGLVTFGEATLSTKGKMRHSMEGAKSAPEAFRSPTRIYYQDKNLLARVIIRLVTRRERLGRISDKGKDIAERNFVGIHKISQRLIIVDQCESGVDNIIH